MRVLTLQLKSAAAPPERDIVLKGLESPLEIKDAEQGLVEAVVATLGVVDRDGDVILPGAIKSGSKVAMSSYGHNLVYGGQPVGKGTIVIEGNKAVFKGQLFLDTTGGMDTFKTLKHMGSDQEWSFGFFTKGSEVPDDSWQRKGARRMLTKLDSREVSPVFRGAGIGTGTVDVKEEGSGDEQPPPAPPAPTEAEAAAAAAAIEEKRLQDEAEAKSLAAAQSARDEFARFERTRRRFG